MIYRENGGYVALCPELDVASQGHSIEDASADLRARGEEGQAFAARNGCGAGRARGAVLCSELDG
jgi:hypothetical protein